MRKILKLNIFHLVEKIVRFHVDCGPQIRIALLTNMRILKFRTQPTIAFFAAVNLLWMQIMSKNCHFGVEWSSTANQYLKSMSSQKPFQSFGAFATLEYLKIWMVFTRFVGYFVQSFSY